MKSPMNSQSITNCTMDEEAGEEEMLMSSYSSQRRSSLTSLNGSKYRQVGHQGQKQQHKFWKPFSMAPSLGGGGRLASRNMSMKMARGKPGSGSGSLSGGRYGKGYAPENV